MKKLSTNDVKMTSTINVRKKKLKNGAWNVCGTIDVCPEIQKIQKILNNENPKKQYETWKGAQMKSKSMQKLIKKQWQNR